MEKCTATILDHSSCTPANCDPSNHLFQSFTHPTKYCGEETFDDSRFCLRHANIYKADVSATGRHATITLNRIIDK